jgi:hypothetical protein
MADRINISVQGDVTNLLSNVLASNYARQITASPEDFFHATHVRIPVYR